MPTCPNCKHKWSTPKKVLSNYREYGITFSDGVFMLVGGYGSKERDLREKAIRRRALAQSCERGLRFLDQDELARVPAISSIAEMVGDNLQAAIKLAFLHRTAHPGWGRALDTAVYSN